MRAYSILIILFFSFSCNKVSPPSPYGAIPTPQQIEWQKMEYYMFIHFGPNTFTNVEWGDGKEDPKVFNPTNLDCRQWASVAKNAGMKGIIITAKHHDGFCLWPSNYSTHTVRESPWKDGKGDVLRELSEACKEFGLKFGVYLSPWDQNHPTYGTDEYNQVFANTLTEVLTGYGEVFEQWFDGANGEGHSGKKQIYDWNLFHKTVYDNQPNAIIFSDIGPGCRWMGNEEGVAGETNWSTLNVKGFGPGKEAPAQIILNKGNMNGEAWVPAETDVSIRPGWFYTPATNNRVKSVEKLVDIYYTSVGRNSNLLLNVPPTTEGLIHPTDSSRLMALKNVIETTFEKNLISTAEITTSNTRGGKEKYSPKNMSDTDHDTYWATDDSVTTCMINIEWKQNKVFNRLLLQEYIPLGQRIAKFKVEYYDKNKEKWLTLTEETTVGYKRILRFPTISTSRLRIIIEESLACPVLNQIGVYKAPETLSSPKINRDKNGYVTISCTTNDPVIHYTIDETLPTASTIKYKEPFKYDGKGTVKAIAFIDNYKENSEIVTEEFDIAPTKWKIISPRINGSERIIDARTETFLRIQKSSPMIIDFGEELNLNGFTYTPFPSVAETNIVRYNVSISQDGNKWQAVKKSAIFNNIKNNPIPQKVEFDKSYPCQFIKIECIESVDNKDIYTVAEIGVITEYQAQ